MKHLNKNKKLNKNLDEKQKKKKTENILKYFNYKNILFSIKYFNKNKNLHKNISFSMNI